MPTSRTLLERLARHCLFGCLAMCSLASFGEDLLPSGRLFRPTFADPQEIRMMLSISGEEKLTAIVGNYFSLLGVTGNGGALAVHFGLEGRGFFTMRQESARFPLETVDGMLGAYLEGRVSDLQWQLRYTHVSAHIADGLDVEASAFSREYLSLRLGYVPNDHFQLYLGASHVLTSYPQTLPWTAQVGASYFLPLSISVTPYFAFDAQYRQEWHGVAGSLQLGLSLGRTAQRYRSLRLFYGLYTGGDMRGRFFGQPTTTHSIGLEMQI